MSRDSNAELEEEAQREVSELEVAVIGDLALGRSKAGTPPKAAEAAEAVEAAEAAEAAEALQRKQLRAFFEGQVAAAVLTHSGITIAIENGAPRNNAADNIEAVLEYMAAQVLAVGARAGESLDQLQKLVPLGESDDDGFPYVPVTGEAVKSEGVVEPPWCWALRMGIARDRVLAYARVKQALLNHNNISASPELQQAHENVFTCAQRDLRVMELQLMKPHAQERVDPALEIESQRASWKCASQEFPGAHRQQPTFGRGTSVMGYTAMQVAARAADPRLEAGEAHYAQLAKDVEKLMPERDALIGTETFVSVSFPATDHQSLFDAGADEGGVHTAERAQKMPALVTLHNATGVLVPIAAQLNNSFNALVVDDSAEFLAVIWALITQARTDPVNGGRILPPNEQRQPIVLTYSV